jgi:hypothetical protein
MESKRDRLQKYWVYKGFKNAAEFSEHLGLHQDHIGKVNSKGASNKLTLKLTELCPDLNLTWVFTGEGDMLRSDTKKTQTPEHLSFLFNEVERVFSDKRTLAEQHEFMAKMLKALSEENQH